MYMYKPIYVYIEKKNKSKCAKMLTTESGEKFMTVLCAILATLKFEIISK